MNDIVPTNGPPDRGENQNQHDQTGNAGDPGGAGGAGGAEGPRRARRRRNNTVPTAEQCLHQLGQLPGLIAMGVIKPAQASAIRATLGEILRDHRRTAAAGGAIGDDQVEQLLGQSPEVLNLIAPLLTDAQLDKVMDDDGN